MTGIQQSREIKKVPNMNDRSSPKIKQCREDIDTMACRIVTEQIEGKSMLWEVTESGVVANALPS